jgi:hypothetical protein
VHRNWDRQDGFVAPKSRSGHPPRPHHPHPPRRARPLPTTTRNWRGRLRLPQHPRPQQTL